MKNMEDDNPSHKSMIYSDWLIDPNNSVMDYDNKNLVDSSIVEDGYNSDDFVIISDEPIISPDYVDLSMGSYKDPYSVPVSILGFTWNTQSVRLCESLDENVVKQHRRHPFNHWSGECKIMDFWPQLREKVEVTNPTLVAFSFQEDARPGSYAHSDLLVEEMDKIGYTLLARDKLIGAGKTSVQNISKRELMLRGLRLSVYVRKDVQDQFRVNEPNGVYTNSLFKNKGMIAIYITLPNNQVLAIINAHLPFSSTTLFESVDKLDPMIRQNAVFKQNEFFNKAYRELVHESPIAPSYVMLMGDLNYRIHPPIEWNVQLTGQAFLDANSVELRELVNQHDELRRQVNSGNIYPLKEGVRNWGPTFKPTCKVSHDRDPNRLTLDSFKLSHNRRSPSYCDRILYESLSDGIELSCISYDRFDFGNMTHSDHSGVIGIFEFGYPNGHEGNR